MVLTDSLVARFSDEIIKTLDEKLSTKLGRKTEENYPIGTDLIYKIRPACNSRVIAVPFVFLCISLFFREWGENGYFFKE